MKIKKQDEQHMVIGPVPRQRLGWILVLAVAIMAGFVGFRSGGFTNISGAFICTISVILGLMSLGSPQDRKVTIDKLNWNISVEERRFILIHRRRIITFSDVTSVDLDKKNIWFFNIFAIVENLFDLPMYGGQFRQFVYDAWQVSLNIDGKKVRIDHTLNRANMHSLASSISKFIDKELKDSLLIPKSSLKKSQGH